jgi:hypothetical protein
MTLLDAIHQMEQIREALQRTYADAFPQPLPYGSNKIQMPRYGWEVRIASAAKKLDEAITKLKSAVVEADPSELKGPVPATENMRICRCPICGEHRLTPEEELVGEVCQQCQSHVAEKKGLGSS